MLRWMFTIIEISIWSIHLYLLLNKVGLRATDHPVCGIGWNVLADRKCFKEEINARVYLVDIAAISLAVNTIWDSEKVIAFVSISSVTCFDDEVENYFSKAQGKGEKDNGWDKL